jgi:hypothetical protein
MNDLFADALAPGVTLEEFFMEHLERIHDTQKGEFHKVSAEPLVMSFDFPDTGERYTFALSSDGCEVEDDELADFPVATLIGTAGHWEAIKPDLLELARALEKASGDHEQRYGGRAITRDILDEFERFDGTIVIEVTGGSAGEPVTFELALNDYVKHDDADFIKVKIDYGVALEMAAGTLEPRDARGKVKLSGKTSFGLELAGFFSAHFEP